MHKFDKRGPKAKRKADRQHQVLVDKLRFRDDSVRLVIADRERIREKQRLFNRKVGHIGTQFHDDPLIPDEINDKFTAASGLDPSKRQPERLFSAAILRDEVVHSGPKSHAEIRQQLGDDDPYRHTPGDVEGFYTSHCRFLTRHESVPIGVGSGQLTEDWRNVRRELLSSDIRW